MDGGVVKKSTIGAGNTKTSLERRWIAAEVATTGASPVVAGHTREVLAPRAAVAHILSCTTNHSSNCNNYLLCETIEIHIGNEGCINVVFQGRVDKRVMDPYLRTMQTCP